MTAEKVLKRLKLIFKNSCKEYFESGCPCGGNEYWKGEGVFCDKCGDEIGMPLSFYQLDSLIKKLEKKEINNQGGNK